MFLFYSSECDGEIANLLDMEANHCRLALRKQVGDQINVTDGKGNAFLAEIISLGKKKVETQVVEKIDLGVKRDYKIHIAIAPTKNIARFEWFLEKATEFGIDEISPILCERSERKVIKEERLNKILISAMKQSLKTQLPILHPLTKYDKFIASRNEDQKFIAHLEDDDTKLLIQSYKRSGDVLIMIGPEGDFTQVEINAAKKNSFYSTSLGDYRLRTETAGIAAVTAIHFSNSL